MARVYLDANILIYIIEGHPDFGDAAIDLINKLNDNRTTAIVSDLAICECLMGAYKQGNQALIDQHLAFFEEAQGSALFQAVEFMPSALEQVPELAANYGLKILDAMHLSLALQVGCDAFATNDKGFAQAEAALDIIGL